MGSAAPLLAIVVTQRFQDILKRYLKFPGVWDRVVGNMVFGD